MGVISQLSVLKKLRDCRHENMNVFDYIRDDSVLDELFNRDDYEQRQEVRDHLTGMRFCLNCGATQRFRLRDPLAITTGAEKEPWLAPWIWRKQ